MNTPRYQKLPGGSRGVNGTSRIWLGEDHLLVVQSSGYTETYRRFFLKDIQAIVFRPNSTGRIWTGVWAGLWILFALFALAASDSVGSPILLGLGMPFAIALVVHLLRGRTCTCHIRTAVATERVPALGRVRTVDKFLAQVEPLILAAQENIPPEQWGTDLNLFQAGQWSGAQRPPGTAP